MNPATLTFLGSGDAFGSGGRLQTCMLLDTGAARILIDCGASALVSLRRHGVDPASVDAVVLSHLHGDHYGGVPFLVLDGQLVSRRERPLPVLGPPGTTERIPAAMEVLFPGSSTARRKFALEVHDLTPGETTSVPQAPGLTVRGHVVQHPSGAPPLALRLAWAATGDAPARSLAYTGDTAWCEGVVEAARDVDLLVAEGYTYEKEVPYHLNWRTLAAHLPALGAQRVVLTHMSADMLARVETLDVACAEDGMVVSL